MNLRVILFAVPLIVNPIICITSEAIDISELEQTVQQLNISEKTVAQWDICAEKCLLIANDLLNNKYDYYGAIKWFNLLINLYNTLKDRGLLSPAMYQQAAQSYIGIAMTYHLTGRLKQRDECMTQAQQLLGIPDNTHNENRESFDPGACSYFVVDGYRFFGDYQACKPRASLDLQEAYLHNAEYSFQKAIAISNAFETNELDKSHAIHGLGTVFEFLSKCQQERGNKDEAMAYQYKAISAFEKAAKLRRQLLENNHLHLARSFHKLARNYGLLGTMLKNIKPKEASEYFMKAHKYYKKSLSIFAQSKLSQIHPKREELEKEYTDFQKLTKQDGSEVS